MASDETDRSNPYKQEQFEQVNICRPQKKLLAPSGRLKRFNAKTRRRKVAKEPLESPVLIDWGIETFRSSF